MTDLRRFTAHDLWKLRRVGDPVPSPDGRFVVVGVKTYDVEKNEGTERLWLVPIGEQGAGEPRPLTAPDVSSGQPAVSPDGRRLAFVRKPAGAAAPADRPQVHVMPLDGGEAARVTDLPLGAYDPRWLPDGRRLVVVAPVFRADLTVEGTRRLRDERAKTPVVPHVTEDRVYRFWDGWLTSGEVPHLFVVDVDGGGEARDLTPDSERWFDFMEPGGQYDVSPDGAELAFAANSSRPPHARFRWAIYTVPVAGGPTTCLTPDNPGDDAKPRYSPDGRWLVYGTRRDRTNFADRIRIVRVDRRTGVHVILTDAWDRAAGEWSFADERTLVVAADDRARVALFTLPVDGGPAVPAPLLRDGGVHSPRAAGGWVYFNHGSLRRPPELARVPLAGGAVERVTRMNDELMAGIALGEVEDLEVRGAGGAPVHLLVVYPPGFDPAKKWPLVQVIHGGPYGAFGDLWHWRWNAQALAAPGYVLAHVNFHGSSGYGQAFANAILGDWGGKAAADVEAGTDALLARGFIDETRMALTGGSFGGYMTCWLASQTSRYRCGIAHAAVYDVDGLLASDVTQDLERELGAVPWGGPEERAAAQRWNPAAFAHGLRTPMLVIHGEKDYRVPAAQALHFYGVLKAKGVEARLVYYSDENHWILKPKNSLHWYGELHGWLARWLG